MAVVCDGRRCAEKLGRLLGDRLPGRHDYSRSQCRPLG